MPVSDPHAALGAHFGFAAFRPGQEEAVRAALAGRDVLVVMPTGAGKSLCYQLPALMRDDLTLVVSPLVSLMQDQVQALARRAPGRVALVNGQQEPAANDAALAAAVRGEVRVLYVSPERFSAPGFARALRPARVGLFVVDEAHCVSQWGHDFRPDYFRLADAARWLGAEAVVASTATATPAVAADIVARLGLADPVRVSTGFDRPNLSWSVVPSTPGAQGLQVAAALSEPGATPAIVYAGTRRHVDALAVALGVALDRPVSAYHAGLGRAARAEAQRRFMDGETGVVVATNAFGMGVDKADVRTVVHATVPASVEAYYQEAGRAGRDGVPSRALLLASPRDKALHVHFIRRAEVTEQHVERIAAHLVAAAGRAAAASVYDVPLSALGARAAAAGDAVAGAPAASDHDRARVVVGALARAGVIQPAPAPVDRVRGRLVAPFDARARAVCRTIVGDARRARWRQYGAIWGYVERPGCRREAILRHFGDAVGGSRASPCCDACDAGIVPRALRAGMPRRAGLAAPPVHVDVDVAVLALVAELQPVGRDTIVTVLRGRRSAEVARRHLDGLPAYGTLADVALPRLEAAIDALLAARRLGADPGTGPRLLVVAEPDAAAAA